MCFFARCIGSVCRETCACSLQCARALAWIVVVGALVTSATAITHAEQWQRTLTAAATSVALVVATSTLSGRRAALVVVVVASLLTASSVGSRIASRLVDGVSYDNVTDALQRFRVRSPSSSSTTMSS